MVVRGVKTGPRTQKQFDMLQNLSCTNFQSFEHSITNQKKNELNMHKDLQRTFHSTARRFVCCHRAVHLYHVPMHALRMRFFSETKNGVRKQVSRQHIQNQRKTWFETDILSANLAHSISILSKAKRLRVDRVTFDATNPTEDEEAIHEQTPVCQSFPSLPSMKPMGNEDDIYEKICNIFLEAFDHISRTECHNFLKGLHENKNVFKLFIEKAKC